MEPTATFAGVAFVTKGGGDLDLPNEIELGIRGSSEGYPFYCFRGSQNTSQAGRLILLKPHLVLNILA